jgi:uncharacterized protein YfaS (alpha-2-macroglobulin family)
VEEYKKPEYEVKIDAPKEPVQLGDKFSVAISADYYFGACDPGHGEVYGPAHRL